MPRSAVLYSQRQTCNSFEIRVLYSEGYDVDDRQNEKEPERQTLFSFLPRLRPLPDVASACRRRLDS